MRVTPTEIPDVRVLHVPRFGDHRGWFSELWRADQMPEAGIDAAFVQDNASLSAEVGTLRGLHFQIPPRAQGKLIRVVRGAIFDVAVDLRRSSSTFGRHVAVTLTAESGDQLWVPAGFAHGFCTLEPATEVSYKVTDTYSQAHDRGLRWDDPDLAIAWPCGEPHLSAKDRGHPGLKDLPAWFA